MKKETVILTPVYKNIIYQYHECSNCKEKIYFDEDIYSPCHFKEDIKYCPFCGNEVIRYAKPKYEETPDWSWMDTFRNILNEAERKIEYEIFCRMNKEEKSKLIDKSEFGIEYFGNSTYWNSNANICEIVKETAYRKPHYTYTKKLESEFNK